MCSRNSPGSPFSLGAGANVSNKYRSEDIMSCISALDEVIAEFDDPSLPYIYEDDTSIAQPQYACSSQEVPSSSPTGTEPPTYISVENLVLRSDGANQVEHHRPHFSPTSSPFEDKKMSRKNPSSHSHFIQIPVSSSKPSYLPKLSESGKAQTIEEEKTHNSVEKVMSGSTPSSLSDKLQSKPSVMSRKSSDGAHVIENGPKKVSKSEGACGGTYSKGTNYEIILPRIPSSSDKPSSSRNHVLQEPIYSSIGKSRPQISLGMFATESGHSHSYPQEPEIDYNEEHHVYNSNDLSKNDRVSSTGSGRMSKSSSTEGGSQPIQMVKELWNFPSEKNLPRSLRKTRKTCFLDDGEGDQKLDGKSNNEVETGGKGHEAVASGHSTANSTSSKVHSNNERITKMDGSRKIYDDIVIPSSRNVKCNDQGSPQFETRENERSPSLSSCSSISFNSFNASSSSSSAGPPVPMPKPRVRQQVPNEQINVKYPPGKFPKPNPKPGASNDTQIQISVKGASSPFSPASCEKKRTEDGGQTTGTNNTEEQTTVVLPTNNEQQSNGMKNLNNGAIQNGNNGHMMRMMMMMKPASNAKNNSTGSASSISSSSSGGDPNYYRKDNLSSSSGVVVTTNSSTTTDSPTHSVNNNNVTIINTEHVHNGGSSVLEVKEGRQQRGHSGGNKSGGCQVQQLGPNNKPTLVLPSGVLDVDDGYLSMINRNEAPLLWPEEFIENETFSPAELRRLSVHLPEEDTSPSDSDSCSEDKEIELEIVDYEREPSRRHPLHDRPKSPMPPRNMEKTEYFSDDSLEGEREREMKFYPKKSPVSPYLFVSNPSPKPQKNIRSSGTSTSVHPFHHQQITVNTALVQPTKGHVSRIPKIISGAKGIASPEKKKVGPRGSKIPNVSPKLPRKPCSFFVSLMDEGSTEVNVSNKSSSLPMGSKLGISPMRKRSVPETPESSVTPTDTKSHRKPKPMSGSNLPQPPQLRHTKSINNGGPLLHKANNNASDNANKRKSTSDLVTVVALNQVDREMEHNEIEPLQRQQASGVPVTTSFNRTSTFLIPSPCSRTMEDENVTRQAKRPRDDETDNEDDFSSDFDLVSPAEPDSLQPLSLTDVHDFVFEIMDTALRQEIQRTQMALNNYPLDASTSTNTSNEPTSSNDDYPHNFAINEIAPSQPIQVQDEHQVESDKEKNAMSQDVGASNSSCDNDQSEQEKHNSNNSLCGDERARVAEQLEAVVSTFLSDNQSFLVQGEGDDEKEQIDTGGSDKSLPITKEIITQTKSDDIKPNTKVSDNHDPMDDKEGKMAHEESLSKSTVLSLPLLTEQDDLPGRMLPLMNSTPLPVLKQQGESEISSITMKDASLVGEEKILDVDGSEEESEEGDSEEQPPEFIPTPPPNVPPSPIPQTPSVLMMPQKTFYSRLNANGNHFHNSNVRQGKAALDLLAERIQNSKKYSPDDQLPVSHFIHDKRNIWAMYDRPFDEDLLSPPNHTGRGYASRSQENLMDAMTKERFHKSFSGRGQSSTLPLNCRPPSTQRRSSTFRNMFNKFRKSKPAGPVIKEIPAEYRDDEVQSITSRETGPSEQGKKRGFFSRLFRRSRKN